MRRTFFVTLFFVLAAALALGQGLGIPSAHGGLGFGNLPKFTGIRLNFKDRNVERINGINITAWNAKNDEDQTGVMNGIAVGAPIAFGTADMNGIGVGVFGVGASHNITGVNLGGLGVGAGGNVKGINVGGLGVGGGGNLFGINIGGLGVGSGGNVSGINIGGLGVGAGGKLSGFSLGLLGVGGGGPVSGISIGGIGVGSGADLKGITIGGVGVGSGQNVTGISVGGVGVGAGKSVNGLAVAIIGVGAPLVRGVVVSSAAGGITVKGLMIVPAYFRVGDKKKGKTDEELTPGQMTGVSISAFNYILGSHNGVSIGIFNYTHHQRGFQLGVLNHVKDNPKGLRWLPIFNTSF